jgi:hypothetical protein
MNRMRLMATHGYACLVQQVCTDLSSAVAHLSQCASADSR